MRRLRPAGRFVFFFIDAATLPLLQLGGMNVNCGDVLHFPVMVTALWPVIRRGKAWLKTPMAAFWHLLFLAWLMLAAAWGWRIYA